MPESIFEWVYVVILTSVLAWFIGRQKWTKNLGLSVLEIRGLLVFKVVVGIALAIFYEVYYGSRITSDAFRFYDDALIVVESLSSNPKVYFQIIFGINMVDSEVVAVTDQLNTWYKSHQHGVFNDNQTMVRMNAIILPLSQGYYHVHTVIVALLSFSGFVALLQVFNKVMPLKRWFVYFIVLFPQVLFWSSGVLKESILFFCLGWFIYFLYKVYQGDFTKENLLRLVIFLYFLLLIKSYVILALIPGITILSASVFVPKLKSPMVFIGMLFLLGIFVIGVDSYLGNPRSGAIYQKQHDFINEAKSVKAGSYFEIFRLEPNWKSILKNSPQAIANVFLRPMPWNSHNLISKLASVENIFILLLLILPVLFYKKNGNLEIVLFSLSFVFVLFLLIGLVTPVSGALVRYKIPGLPFLFFSIYMMVDWEKFGSKLKFSR
ncbi:MAG: hypothetical protein CL840_16695 [Crocinitomicaceae bacterium]|nr:hypothetical protein [Crocinitomicaceae bacterium]|tara:strand:- start:8340 stop:9644 length:1305 start_codon:yes stop_codon:yes gene_type:complete